MQNNNNNNFETCFGSDLVSSYFKHSMKSKYMYIHVCEYISMYIYISLSIYIDIHTGIFCPFLVTCQLLPTYYTFFSELAPANQMLIGDARIHFLMIMCYFNSRMTIISCNATC